MVKRFILKLVERFRTWRKNRKNKKLPGLPVRCLDEPGVDLTSLKRLFRADLVKTATSREPSQLGVRYEGTLRYVPSDSSYWRKYNNIAQELAKKTRQ